MKKKGVSNLVSYVILIAILLGLGTITYTSMKSYIPKQMQECPDEISIFVKDYYCTSNELSLVLKNNGKFNIGGYLIYVTNNPQVELATIDISKNITFGGTPLMPSGIKLDGVENSFYPNDEENHTFDISSIDPRIYSIEIVPMRWQEQGRRNTVVSCINSKMKKSLTCV